MVESLYRAWTGLLLCSLLAGCAVLPGLHEDEQGAGSVSPAALSVIDEYRLQIPGLMKEHGIPGLSISVVDRKAILWTAGFGFTDLDRRTPVTPDTLFSIQSMTKPVTATAVMLAAQAGLLDLDQPIVKYLPEFTVQSRFEQDAREKITMRLLLSHTSGLAHEAPVGNNKSARFPSFEAHVRSISDTWLGFRVGERYGYSNLGYDLAAFILQVVAGKPFPQYVKENLFDPLGMSRSSADMRIIMNDQNRAVGHDQLFSAIPVEIPMVGAGGVYSTARDMARFVQFHLNGGAVDGRRLLDGRFINAMYILSSSSSPDNYGLGFTAWEKHGTYLVNHNGGGFGFLATMSFYPELGIGCVVLTNSTDHGNQQVELAHRVLDSLIDGGAASHGSPGAFPSTAEVFKAIADKPAGNAGTGTPGAHDFGTAYRPEFSKHEGAYRYIFEGFQFKPYISIAFALGFTGSGSSIEVREKAGYLCVDGEKLEEHLPGLFFTESGDSLDFRGTSPRWRNLGLVKVR